MSAEKWMPVPFGIYPLLVPAIEGVVARLKAQSEQAGQAPPADSEPGANTAAATSTGDA